VFSFLAISRESNASCPFAQGISPARHFNQRPAYRPWSRQRRGCGGTGRPVQVADICGEPTSPLNDLARGPRSACPPLQVGANYVHATDDWPCSRLSGSRRCSGDIDSDCQQILDRADSLNAAGKQTRKSERRHGTSLDYHLAAAQSLCASVALPAWFLAQSVGAGRCRLVSEVLARTHAKRPRKSPLRLAAAHGAIHMRKAVPPKSRARKTMKYPTRWTIC
jgi:hypothetical protein